MRLSSDGNSLTGRLLSGITSTILLLGGESSTAEKTLFGRNGVGSRVSARLTKACRLAWYVVGLTLDVISTISLNHKIYLMIESNELCEYLYLKINVILLLLFFIFGIARTNREKKKTIVLLTYNTNVFFSPN